MICVDNLLKGTYMKELEEYENIIEIKEFGTIGYNDKDFIDVDTHIKRLKNYETTELPNGKSIKENKGLKIKFKLDSDKVMKDVRKTMKESIKKNIEVIL